MTIPDSVADAALAAWDALARSGVWPISITQLRADLCESGTFIAHKPLRKLTAHRRWAVLDDLVRQDIQAWQREESLAADPR